MRQLTLVVLATITAGIMSASPNKVLICHAVAANGSEPHKWLELNVNQNGWNGHDGHPLDYIKVEGVPCGETPPPPPPPPVEDVCPNLEGTHTTVPAGYELVNGQCVPIEPPPSCPPGQVWNEVSDMCEVPTCPPGYTWDENLGECVPPPPPPATDMCTDIPGIQPTVPVGYVQVGTECKKITEPTPTTPTEPVSGTDIVDFCPDPDLMSGFPGERVKFSLIWKDRWDKTQGSGLGIEASVKSSTAGNASIVCTSAQCTIWANSPGTFVAVLYSPDLDLKKEVRLVVIPPTPEPLSKLFIGMPSQTQVDQDQTATVQFWPLDRHDAGNTLQVFYGDGLPRKSAVTLSKGIHQGEVQTVYRRMIDKECPVCVPFMLRLSQGEGANGTTLAEGRTEACIKVNPKDPAITGSFLHWSGSEETGWLNGFGLGAEVAPLVPLHLDSEATGVRMYMVLTYGPKFATPIEFAIGKVFGQYAAFIGTAAKPQGYNVSLPPRQYNVAIIVEYPDGNIVQFGAPHSFSVPARIGPFEMN